MTGGWSRPPPGPARPSTKHADDERFRTAIADGRLAAIKGI